MPPLRAKTIALPGPCLSLHEKSDSESKNHDFLLQKIGWFAGRSLIKEGPQIYNKSLRVANR